jgi:hypothetical protein
MWGTLPVRLWPSVSSSPKDTIAACIKSILQGVFPSFLRPACGYDLRRFGPGMLEAPGSLAGAKGSLCRSAGSCVVRRPAAYKGNTRGEPK